MKLINILKKKVHQTHQKSAHPDEQTRLFVNAVRIITQKTGTPQPIIVTPNKAAHNRVNQCTYSSLAKISKNVNTCC